MAPMRAELLTVGSELLAGATLNTNAAELCRRLAEHGLRCHRQVAVADDRPAVAAAIADALARSDIVLLTGGLGPTGDDLTAAAIADATARPLILHAGVAHAIRRAYAARDRRCTPAALRQARLPQGSQPLPNPAGSAPGLWLPLGARLLIALPGVPAEMRAILEHEVLPRLDRLPGRAAIATTTLRSMGLVELDVESRLRLARLPTTCEVGLYPQLGGVDVRLTVMDRTRARAETRLRPAAQRAQRALGSAWYGHDTDALETVVGRLLRRRRWTLGLAESCTGGRLTDRLTNTPGSSAYVRGGIVAYDNRVKDAVLGVPRALLRRHGAVSGPVARAMASGARRVLRADLGLAVTGIAGPSGATAGKPVGLVWFGLADARGARSVRLRFHGGRDAIKHRAAQAALDWLRRRLLTRSPRDRPARRRA